MKNINRTRFSTMLYILFIAATVMLGVSCKKDAIIIPPQSSFFINASGNYTISSPGILYKIPIGITNPSDGKRTVSVTVNSPTGAVEGTHYTLNTKSFTLSEGSAQDTIIVTGIQDQYLSGRKDVLVFSIADDGSHPSNLNKTFTLNVQGPCFDGDITDLGVIGGTFSKSFDADEPSYSVTVSNVTEVTATSGTAQIGNLWNWFSPVAISFDWSDPNNTTVNIPLQETGRNYAAGQPFMIRTSPGQPNTFSVCDQEIRLIVDIVVWNYPTPGSGAFYYRDYEITVAR